MKVVDMIYKEFSTVKTASLSFAALYSIQYGV